MPVVSISIVPRAVFWLPTVNQIRRPSLACQSAKDPKQFRLWSFSMVLEYYLDDVAQFWFSLHGLASLPA